MFNNDLKGSIMSSQPVGADNDEVVSWTDLGQRMWTFLTGRDAAIHYRFEEISVEVPRDTGANAPRATWKIDGTLTITTSDNGRPVSPNGA
ncbi:hypothetical protein GCM10027020_13250 [Nocardioides salsibiostraticola]